MENCTRVNIVITGLYEWGGGWVSNALANRWRTFWNNYDEGRPRYWKFVRFSNPAYTTEYLICTSSSLYLHPERCSCLLDCKPTDCAVDALRRLFQELAKELKCKVEFTVTGVEVKTGSEKTEHFK